MEAGYGLRLRTARARCSTLPFRSTTKKDPMRESEAVIAIVDDDPSVREGLRSLLRSAGWWVETFASAQEFLDRPGAEVPCCLILDLRLPGLSGLDLQKKMAEVELEI